MKTILRFSAAVILILGGGYVGCLAASPFSVRVEQIELFRLALTQISFNIGFLKLPITRAIEEAAKARKGAVGRILLNAAEKMRDAEPFDAFSEAIEQNKTYLCMTDADTEIIREFAENLGKGDTESELNNIKAACAKLKLAYDLADAERVKNVKLRRGIGLLGGILAAILLF